MMDHSDRNDILQTLEGPRNKAAMRPRAGERDVKTVAIGLRSKFGIGLGGDPIAEDGRLALETPFNDVVHSGEVLHRLLTRSGHLDCVN